MSQTRIKMCGMTRSEDIAQACQAGADMVGMVFYEPSPRSVTIEQAARLSRGMPLGVATTLLFVDADAGYIREALSATNADVIQFHGQETPDFCQQFGRRYLKAIRVRDAAQLTDQLAVHDEANGLLLDAYVPGQPGGTGQSFNWGLIPEQVRNRLFLAGGLAPENVGEAIRCVKPYAVDVSGGIEQSKGIKSAERIQQFVRNVRQADSEVNENSS